MNRIRSLGILAVALGLAACTEALKDEDPGCACTTEYRYNVCVTWNGSETLPDTLDFWREREDGSRDSLENGMNCFGELPATQRIVVEYVTTVGDSTEWFTLDTVDCCHGEARTIDMAF